MFMSVLGIIALVGGIAMTCCAQADSIVDVDQEVHQIQKKNAGELGW